jgi:hypothetical protein
MSALSCPILTTIKKGMAMTDFTLWLEFEIWQPQPEDDPEDDFFNMQIYLSTGEKYALNVWTFKRYEGIREQNRHSGEVLGGKYLIPPDLLVQRLNRKLVEDIVADMLYTHSLKDEWLAQDENPE